MRFKRTGLITKIIVLALMVYMASAVLNLHGQIQSVQDQRSLLSAQVDKQRMDNQQLSEAIENSDDPDMLESVARDKGYVKPGETLYVDIAN